MNKIRYPYIIDLEASGLSSNSYPIEVGLALEPGRRYCTLIKPADSWDHWDQQAESVHKINRDILTTRGRPVTEVAHQLNQLLKDKVVYSDAWGVDNSWVVTLFAAAGVDKAFSVSALEMILSEPQIEVWMETRDSVVEELGLARHRASNDARIIQETYIRTLTITT